MLFGASKEYCVRSDDATKSYLYFLSSYRIATAVISYDRTFNSRLSNDKETVYL